MTRSRQLIAVAFSAWATLAYAQDNAGRDLVQKPSNAGQANPGQFYVEFMPGKHDLAGLSSQGKLQAEQVLAALRTSAWNERVVVIESQVCSRPGVGADLAGARHRAEAIRDLILGRQVLTPERVLLVVRGAHERENDEEHAQHQRVLIRPWAEEQMADLAGVLVPPPPSAKVSFWHRSQQAGEFQLLHQGDVVVSGDEFKVALVADQATYAYVFHRGSGGEWACLFPSPETPEIGTNPLEPGREYWLPGVGEGYTLDQTPGREETFVFLGDKPQPRLEQWVLTGVPWEEVGLGAVHPGDPVQVESPARYINWYRRLSFEHQ